MEERDNKEGVKWEVKRWKSGRMGMKEKVMERVERYSERG